MYSGNPPIREAQTPEEARLLAYQQGSMRTSSLRDTADVPITLSRDGDKAIQNASPYERMIQYSPAALPEQQPVQRAAYSLYAPSLPSIRSSNATQYGADGASVYDSYARSSHMDHSRMSHASQAAIAHPASQTQSCMDIRTLSPMPPQVDDHYGHSSSAVTTHQGYFPRGGPDLGHPGMPVAGEYYTSPTMSPAPPFVAGQAADSYCNPNASTSAYNGYSRNAVPAPRDVSPMARQSSPALPQYRNVSNMSLQYDDPASPRSRTPATLQYDMPRHPRSPPVPTYAPQHPGLPQPAPMSPLHVSRKPAHQPTFPQPAPMSPLRGSRTREEDPAFSQPAPMTPIHPSSAAHSLSQRSLHGDRSVPMQGRNALSSMSLRGDREPITSQPVSPMRSKPSASEYGNPLGPSCRESGYSVSSVASPMRRRAREPSLTQNNGCYARESMYEVGMGRPAPETRSISPCPRYRRHLRVGDQREPPQPSMRTTKVIRGTEGC